MQIDPKKRKEQLDNSLMNFRMKYLYEYFKVQLAVVTSSMVILLGFFTNIEAPQSRNLLKFSLVALGAAVVSQMVIHLVIYMRLHSIWYFKPGAESAGRFFSLLFFVNFLLALLGMSLGYFFLFENI